VAEPGAELVPELPVRKAAEETARLEALAVLIFGNLAAAVPAGEPALAVELDLAMEGAQALVRAAEPDLGLAQAQVVELIRGSDRVVVPGRGAEREQVVELCQDSEQDRVEAVQDLDRVVEVVRTQVQGPEQVPETNPPESSLPDWAGGEPPRHY
jgi:hypothetical protein